MTINERIKTFRKGLKLNQKEFGEKIGIKQSALSSIESGVSTVTESNIKLICEKFNLNEQWLRTGEGEKERRDDNTLLKRFLEHGNSKDKAFIEAFLSMPDDAREAVISFIEDSAARFKQADSAQGHTSRTDVPANNGTVSDAERAAMHRQLDKQIDSKGKLSTSPSGDFAGGDIA